MKLTTISSIVISTSLLFLASPLIQSRATLSDSIKVAMVQYQTDSETTGDDSTFANRTLAFNAAKQRANIPLSQNFVDQWIVGNDPKQPRTNNYVFSNNLGAVGRYYKYSTINGPRVVVDHTSDPTKTLPHFHAGQPKGDSKNIKYDFRKDKYLQVNGSHHYYYKP